MAPRRKYPELEGTSETSIGKEESGRINYPDIEIIIDS